MKVTRRGSGLAFSFLISLSQGCSVSLPNPSLPDPSELGSPRGYRLVRVITHFHSPYSYDACDHAGVALDGTLNSVCLTHLKQAMCKNRVGFTFLTDHPDHMASYEMRDLLLLEPEDHLVTKNGQPYANQVGSCKNGFMPTLLVGFEGTEMALGLAQHLGSTADERLDLYARDTLDLRNRLRDEAGAVVIAPHTESRTLDWLRSVQPDAIEIYNFHANLDPKIRQNSLGVPPFKNLPSLITYLVDPYKQLVPDLAFLHFVETFPDYFTKWNTLISEGRKTAGLGASDSHENVLPQIVSDGERMDSHRRVVAMMSNHVLVNSQAPDPDDVKAAIQAGRSWIAFEGLGSPVGMDFYAAAGNSLVGVGETGSLQGGAAALVLKLPTLHSQSPAGKHSPEMILQIKRVLANGKDETVASSKDQEVVWTTMEPGAYRAEILMKPRHLEEYLGDFAYLVDRTYPWIITNHLFLN